MGQDDDLYTNYIPLALHLASDHFLQNESKDVQLLIACCIADILRVFAPEAPYKDSSHIKVGSALPYFLNLGGIFMLFI